jgi:DNA invertase Pin-like site-specific DNA recombinase
MHKRIGIYGRKIGTEPELIFDFRRAVDDRGDTVVAVFTDDARIEGKGKNAGWRKLLAGLDQIDQIVLADVGDLPGKSVKDLLLKILTTLTEHGVSVAVPSMGIDTSTGSAAILALVGAYRAAKLSQAIKRGQKRSVKHIGRPPIPPGVRRRIEAALTEGAGVRPTARKYRVAPASVITIKKSMAAETDRMVA